MTDKLTPDDLAAEISRRMLSLFGAGTAYEEYFRTTMKEITDLMGEALCIVPQADWWKWFSKIEGAEEMLKLHRRIIGEEHEETTFH